MRFVLSLAALATAAFPALAGEFTVGFAEVDITPELGKKPVYMAGFGQDRPAKKVHDPIMTSRVVLADGDTKIALVTVDVVGSSSTPVSASARAPVSTSSSPQRTTTRAGHARAVGTSTQVRPRSGLLEEGRGGMR